MPKIIVKIKHLKASKKVGGLIDYVAKREGVDKTVNEKILIGKPTEKQLEFIDKMLSECPDVKKSFEYEDYIENPTKQNASALITTIAENNPDALGNKETYINYIATRPRVEKLSSHGLFGSEENVNLSEVKKEIENINGVVWTPIISLKREDAERLGYDNADIWRSLIRSKQMELAEIFDIPFDEFKWYGAFHNEAGHPHIHMVVYATGDAKGYITERDIEKVKSVFANEIFKNEMYELYDDKTKTREKLAEETREKIKALADSIREKDYSQTELCEMLVNLSDSLKNCKGKKVYGYLPLKVKKEVDEILETVSKDEDVQKLYNEWCMLQRKIYGIYTDKDAEFAPLWENKEFKKLKNAIVSEAEKLGNNLFFDKEAERVSEEKNIESDTNYSQSGIELDEKKTELPLLTAGERELLGFDIQRRYICDFRNEMKFARVLLYDKKDYENAYNAMVSQVKRGNVPAMFELAKMYQNGLYVGSDNRKMNLLYRKAIEGYLALEKKEPNSFYEYQIGKIYALESENQNMQKAIEWFEISAEKGNEFALFSLANIYYYGTGTDVDYYKAFDYYKRSADKGCVYSYYRLGYMLRNGIGCIENTEESDVWFEKMIRAYSNNKQLQDEISCYRLGRLYEKGWGTEVDFVEAKEYYLIAAREKNSNAEFALARIYFREGNEEECQRYIELAEEHGNEYAREWYEKVKEYRNNQYQPSVIESASNLFCRLASIIENDTERKTEGFYKTIVDSKERKHIIRKKQSLGMKMR